MTTSKLNFVTEYSAPPADERFFETTVGDQLTDLRILANPTNEMYESPNCDSDAAAARAVLEASEAWGLKHFGDQERGVEMPILRADDEDGAYWAFVAEIVLSGAEAISYAEEHGNLLNKYEDPTEEAREGLTPEEARVIAREDPSLIWLSVPAIARTEKV